VDDYVLDSLDNFCVGVVDVKLDFLFRRESQERFEKLNNFFQNSMEKIVTQFNGNVLSKVGNEVMFYFNSKNLQEKIFKNCLECGFTMINFNESLRTILKQEDLPTLNYGVSADYGTLEIWKSQNSSGSTLVGETLNLCYKMSRFNNPKEFVIGEKFFQIVKDYPDFQFSQKKETLEKKDGSKYSLLQITQK